jgi:predicted RNA methylase
MSDSRERFIGWTDCLLDPARTPLEQRQAAQEWCQWGLSFLGIDEHDPARIGDPFFADKRLPTGKAISPLGAARCVREYRRTAVFLQAMAAALRALAERFPHETIHVLEAGCGPLAPLALAFAMRYPSERVQFTLLDLHPTALNGARRLAEELGVVASIRGCLTADAATIQFQTADRPHLIACEVLLRALTKEPQVAVTMNLAPQLRTGGVFLPERINVDAALFSCGRYWAAARSEADEGLPAASKSDALAEVGTVFSLDAENIHRLQPCGAGRLQANAIAVPAHHVGRTPLRLFTRIRVFEQHVLTDFESSLNLPERVVYDPELARTGGELRFAYETSATPGLRLI